MNEFLTYAKSKLNVDSKLTITCFMVYLICGFVTDKVVAVTEIARFTHWWQVLTVYGLYMIPVSLLLRGLPFHMQYAYGLIAVGLLEFTGYTLQSKYAYPNNILDQLFNIRNFSLWIALFFVLYFSLSNALVGKIYAMLFKE